MSQCSQHAITDAAFSGLRSVRVLDMIYCDQRSITDAAFEQLRGSIKSLGISRCTQLTDAAFAPLGGVEAVAAGSAGAAGSAAGVALMGQAKGLYTFSSHLKWSWAVMLGYQVVLAESAEGFIYALSRTGVTGAHGAPSANIAALVSAIKGHTDVPVCVGFGISTPEQAAMVAAAAASALRSSTA